MQFPHRKLRPVVFFLGGRRQHSAVTHLKGLILAHGDKRHHAPGAKDVLHVGIHELLFLTGLGNESISEGLPLGIPPLEHWVFIQKIKYGLFTMYVDGHMSGRHPFPPDALLASCPPPATNGSMPPSCHPLNIFPISMKLAK